MKSNPVLPVAQSDVTLEDSNIIGVEVLIVCLPSSQTIRYYSVIFLDPKLPKCVTIMHKIVLTVKLWSINVFNHVSQLEE